MLPSLFQLSYPKHPTLGPVICLPSMDNPGGDPSSTYRAPPLQRKSHERAPCILHMTPGEGEVFH